MMMFASTILSARRRGLREEEQEAGGQKKADSTGTLTPDADAPIGPTRSGVSDARNRRKHGRWYGVLTQRKGRGGKGPVLSSPDRNRESYQKMNEVAKGYVCRA